MSASSNRRLVIHIGDMKTGTTVIQWSLIEDMKRSGERNYTFPSRSDGSVDAQHDLAGHFLHGNNVTERAWEYLTEKLADNTLDHAIISSEDFFLTDPRRVKNMLEKHIIPLGYQPVIIVYYRPPGEQVSALFSQHAKMLDLNSSFLEFAQKKPTVNRLKSMAHLNRWVSVFGEQVIARPYIRDMFHEKSIVYDFANILKNLGIVYQPSPNLRIANVSPGAKGLEAIRWAATFDPGLLENDRRRLYALQEFVVNFFVNDKKLEIGPEISDALRPLLIDDSKLMDKHFGYNSFAHSLSPIHGKNSTGSLEPILPFEQETIVEFLNNLTV